ncbi:MAG: DnaA family protein [Bacteroidia bacterium]
MAEIESRNGPADLRRQLPLGIRLHDDATLANFLPRPALEPVLAALQGQDQPTGERVIYLHGPAGSGKTHLLQGACHLSVDTALYLPLAELAKYPAADVLQGVAAAQRVCLDDIHAVLNRPEWELALFNLYNQAQQQGTVLLIAADAAPRALSLGLPDLRSRLSAAVVYQLDSAADEEKSKILQFRARQRGMSLGADIASYIVTRAPRDLEKLLNILNILDQASLEQKRLLSIPFVKELLGW